MRVGKSALFNAHAYEFMRDTFIKEQYKFLTKNLKRGTIAVDLGANIGDSTIYLAKIPEVSKVYAYEPYSIFCEEARKNIRLAGVEDKVILNNSMVLNNLDDLKENHRRMSRYHYEGHERNQVLKAVTMAEVLDEVRAAHNAPIIIKCDIDEGEFEIFNQDLDYSKIQKIMMEYHSKDPKLITRSLSRKGFKTEIRRGRIGFITAYRQ